MQGNKISTLLILLISIMGLTACSEPVEEVETIRLVRAIKVGDAQQLAGRKFPGRAKAVDEINLAFDVRGKLNKRPVNVGDNVTEGQLIASLDPRDFRSNVQEKRAAFQNAQANYKRAKELIKKDFISRTEYDRLNASTRMTRAELDRAEKALSDSELIAPFSGYISELYVENFQAVQAKQQVARLVNIAQIEMVIDVPESMISLVPYAQDIKIIFDTFPDREISAAIKEIGKEASSTTRTYPVTLIMEQPEGIKILPGMSGNASARVESGEPKKMIQNKGIQVPVSAIYSPADDKKSYVWLIDEKTGEVHRQVVTLGKMTATGLVIKEGLNAGNWVATAGVHYLRDGQKVKIMQNQMQNKEQ